MSADGDRVVRVLRRGGWLTVADVAAQVRLCKRKTRALLHGAVVSDRAIYRDEEGEPRRFASAPNG